MPTEIEATYKVVAPMFCAGADPQRAELRLPSFTGVLRFWWRALAWSRCGADLKAIGRQEDKIFGSASGGQSRVSMRWSVSRSPPQIRVDEALTISGQPVGEGARYLGYGVMGAFGRTAAKLTRACLRAPFEFTVQMRARDLNAGETESVKDALIALGTLGGMGAKSRKGYGSLVIRSLRRDGVERWRAPQSRKDLCDAIGALRRDRDTVGLPEFTAVSGQTRHVLVDSARARREPLELLNLVGCEMMRFRSWGHNGKVLGAPSEKNFKDDHDLMKSVKHRRRPREHPRRVAFGLPHNYGKGPNQQVGPSDGKLDRRASPLFIHIHECADTPVAVLSLLPARFLPEGKSAISVGGQEVRQAPEKDLYRPIHDFLDRFLDPDRCKEPLTAIEVRS